MNNIVTIRNLLDHGLNEHVNYKDRLVLSRVNNLNLFCYPCHLQAITILVCLNGEIDCHVNLNKYKLGEKSVLINFPDNIIQTEKVRNLQCYAVLISNEYMHELALDIHSQSYYYSHEVDRNSLFTLPDSEIKNISSFFSLISNAITSPIASTNDAYINSLVISFLTNVMLLSEAYHQKNADMTPAATRSHRVILHRFIELVREYHCQERELKFYADRMCITSKYLSEVVMKSSGRKATEWISEFVILEAKSLLRYSGLNIQEISRQLHFPTQSAFGKYFKSQTNLSPREFMESRQTI